jgi:hypothetical protein
MARRKHSAKAIAAGVQHHGFYSQAQWRYFFANKALKAKYAHNAAHATQARGGGPKVAFHKLPHKKHPGKHVAR